MYEFFSAHRKYRMKLQCIVWMISGFAAIVSASYVNAFLSVAFSSALSDEPDAWRSYRLQIVIYYKFAAFLFHLAF